MRKTAVGITTRNRPEVLRTALESFAAFHTEESFYVIVDDNSDTHEENREIVDAFRNAVNVPVFYRYSSERLGICNAKNACLAKMSDCDHIFLFDDDCWPQKAGWSSWWADNAETFDVHHSTFCLTLYPTDNPNTVFHVTETRQNEDKCINSWSNCFGVALHFSKTCIDRIGGYDHIRSKNVYGYEHAQMSKRAERAGLTAGMRYPAPCGIEDWIYSFDISWRWRKMTPPFDIPWKEDFASSVTPEEAALHTLNSSLMSTNETYVEIIDPIKVSKVDVVIPTKSNDTDLFALLDVLYKDPSVNEIVVVADGEETRNRLEQNLMIPVTLLSVERSVGLHRMWNLGMDHVNHLDNHVAIINDDVSLSEFAITNVARMLDEDSSLGLISPSDNLNVSDHLIKTTGFAGFCMVMAKDIAREWRFDERMKWWYGDSDVMSWVSKTKKRVTGLTGNAHAIGNRSKTINSDPPPNFHRDIENDARIYKEKWS